MKKKYYFIITNIIIITIIIATIFFLKFFFVFLYLKTFLIKIIRARNFFFLIKKIILPRYQLYIKVKYCKYTFIYDQDFRFETNDNSIKIHIYIYCKNSIIIIKRWRCWWKLQIAKVEGKIDEQKIYLWASSRLRNRTVRPPRSILLYFSSV